MTPLEQLKLKRKQERSILYQFIDAAKNHTKRINILTKIKNAGGWTKLGKIALNLSIIDYKTNKNNYKK